MQYYVSLHAFMSTSGIKQQKITFMKKLSTIVAFLLMGSFIFAQQQYKAENEGWLVSLEEAYQQSNKTGKPIMANFTGSDWCGWCKKLTASVFSQPKFKSWAKENVILLELDFPRRKQLPNDIQQQNFNMQQALQVRGYPTVWVFNLKKDSQKNFQLERLGKTGYKPSVEEFIADVEQMLVKSGKGD